MPSESSQVGEPPAAGAVPPSAAPPAAALHVNQVGYLVDGPKAATLVWDGPPLPWRCERDGAVLARGTTAPRGVDPSAGLAVHTVDFSEVRTAGSAELVVGGDEGPALRVAVTIGDDVYRGLREDALAVFYGQRSGIAIDEALLGPGYGRAAGHLEDGAFGGDTAVACLPAGAATTAEGVDLYEGWTDSHTLDVRGGWYDAGDHGKYVVNGGISVAQLLGLYERARRRGTQGALGDGSLRVPEHGNGVPDVLDEARWELEWMLRMRVPAGSRFAGLVHHKVVDERWTQVPLLPADDPQRRYLHRPSTAAALNLAAAAAQGARLFRPFDAAFADRLLDAARSAYAAAAATPGLLAPDTNTLADAGGGPYDDTDLDDERYWAATELYLTTREDAYLADLRANPFHVGGTGRPFDALDWQRVGALGRLDLATVRSPIPELGAVRASVVEAADALVDLVARQPFGQPYAPADGRYEWGSNGLLANNLVVLATAHDLTGERVYRDAVLSGIDYLFGRNALGLSYVTGWGARTAHRQHSRWYAHQVDPSLPSPPRGTLSGGPNSDTPDPVSRALAGSPAQLCYVDDIEAWGVNEMTINWNAPLAWVASYLADLSPAPTAGLAAD